MKRRLSVLPLLPGWLALAGLLALGTHGLLAAAAEAEELIDGIAAQVGSEIVLASEVYQVSAPAEARVEQEGGNDADLARLHAEVLERLIERALIRQVVRRAELDATEAEVDDAVAAIAQENGLSAEQLRQSVEAQGLPFDIYRETIRAEIEQSKVLNGMVASKVRVEESEIRAFYDEEFSDQPSGGVEVHLRHLMVPFDPENPALRSTACDEVRFALIRLQGGESFESVASQVSEVNPERGGDIGWLHVETLASWMADPVAGLEPGGTSGVLETTFGCNLLHLVDRRTFEPVSYEDAREQIRKHLFNNRMAQEYKEFMEQLRSRTYIERKGMFAEAARLESAPTSPEAAEEF